MIPVEEIESIVNECIARHAGISPAQVRRNSVLTGLGMSGEKKVAAIIDVERWFGVILLPYIAEITTAGELTGILIGCVNNLTGAFGLSR